MQPPETVSEPRYETGTRMDDNTEAQTRAISALSHKLPEITVKPEQLMDAGALYPMEYGTDTDVIFFADINHDGEPERITAGLLDLQASGGQDSSLKVLAGESADSPVIWKHDYSLAHAGWSMLYPVSYTHLDVYKRQDLMKGCISYEIVRLMGEGMHPQEACETAVSRLDAELRERRGEAGDLSLIAMNPKGEWGVATNIEGFSFRCV